MKTEPGGNVTKSNYSHTFPTNSMHYTVCTCVLINSINTCFLFRCDLTAFLQLELCCESFSQLVALD